MRILERQPNENYEKYKQRIEGTKRILYDLPIWENNEYMRYAPVDISEVEEEKSKAVEEEKQRKKNLVCLIYFVIQETQKEF